MGECTNTGGFQPKCSVGVCETEDALRAAQSLHDAITEELLDQFRAGGTYPARLLQAPLSIMGKELTRIRRQVIQDRTSIPGAMRAHVGGDQPIILKD